MKVVISGSFRKHLQEIGRLKKELEEKGIIVLKPDNIQTIENPDRPNFVKFIGEENKSSCELELEYLHAIKQCDAHIIFNKDNYIGNSAAMEMGCSFMLGKTYLLEAPNFELIKQYDEDAIETYAILLEFINDGTIKVGIDTMLSDFGINNKTARTL